jgi:hypothetical protein
MTTPYTLPEPSCTYADHSYPAFTKAQMQAAFAAGAASRDDAFAQLEQDYTAKCAELELVHAARDAEVEALRSDAARYRFIRNGGAYIEPSEYAEDGIILKDMYMATDTGKYYADLRDFDMDLDAAIAAEATK